MKQHIICVRKKYIQIWFRLPTKSLVTDPYQYHTQYLHSKILQSEQHPSSIHQICQKWNYNVSSYRKKKVWWPSNVATEHAERRRGAWRLVAGRKLVLNEVKFALYSPASLTSLALNTRKLLLTVDKSSFRISIQPHFHEIIKSNETKHKRNPLTWGKKKQPCAIISAFMSISHQ